jgi:hypothetical protein
MGEELNIPFFDDLFLEKLAIISKNCYLNDRVESG